MYMHIKQVDIFPLAYTEPNDDNSQRHVVLARIQADDGTVGWGECVTIFREATYATAALLKYGLAEILIGRDAYDIRPLWDAMREKVWWYGDSGGIAALAISALDMALWDLKGKLLKQSLSQLLGGALRDRLPACASSHPRLPTIEGLADELAGHIKQGFQLVKVGFGKRGEANLGVDERRDVEFVRAAREAIGASAGFIVDVGAKIRWDVPRAIRMAEAFSESNLTWLEDPFQPTNLAAYASLRSAVPHMPIGFGERFWNVEDYRRMLLSRPCDVILVDPGRVEGVTGMQLIGEVAAQNHVSVDAHSWATGINTAASLHLSLCVPRPTIFELKPKPSVVQHELIKTPIAPVDGWVYAPEGYGLGVEVDEDVVRQLTIQF
jgi:L-alanine-DL-glutamate epimerase-like enolase superfamily enzyme